MYIIMNVMSTFEIRGTAYPLAANRSPSPALARSDVQPRTPRRCRTHPYLLPALPLDSRQQGRLCATSHRGRYRTFFDGHVLGIRGSDPRLRWRRYQRGEMLPLRQGLPARTGAVLRTLRDVRPVTYTPNCGF